MRRKTYTNLELKKSTESTTNFHYSDLFCGMMLQRSSAGKRKRTGDLDVEIKCYMTLQPSEKDEFVQSIKQLYQSESLCDITFKVGGQMFPAHKIILAAANR